jgi:hypothetical protein
VKQAVTSFLATMEEAVRFPQATLTGIQFGLSSSREIVSGMNEIEPESVNEEVA